MTFAFGDHELDIERRELRRAGQPVALEPQVFDLLVYLIRNRRRVVSKDDLIESIWGGRIVSESAVTARLNAARKAIGDSGAEQRLIRTFPRKGVRFVGVVRETEAISEAVSVTLTAPPSVAVAAPVPAKPTIAERRQLTVAACELVFDKPAGAGPLDPEDLRDAIDDWHQCVARTARSFNGFVGPSVGNTVLVCFGYPVAREDDVEQAVRASLELRADVETCGTHADARTRVRIGIATGRVIVGDPEAGEAQARVFIGEAPGPAARLQSAAQPGTILIDTETRQLVGRLFDCGEADPTLVSGTFETLRAWRVLGAGAIESRFEARHLVALTPLVGRNEEMELLLRRWTQAKSGEGRVVLISGEPGIGKSRLAAALQERLRCEPHALARYFCAPHSQSSALRPFAAWIEREAGFEPRDTAERKFNKLVAVLRDACSPEDMAIMADLLALPAGTRALPPDLTPPRRREQIFDILSRRLERLARERPLLMVFEDLHWIDPSSLELLDRLVERTPQLPVLLVITSRPDMVASWIGLPWTTTLTLNRLDQRESVALMEHIDGSAGLPAAFVDELVARCDGVPLFIEEMTKALVESSHAGGDRVDGPARAPSIAVPMSLQSSLIARLDRIGPGHQVAQIGAAIGRQFSFDLISALELLPDEDLSLGLQELTDAQLVFRRGTPPDAEYTFKHALVQDIAYESLLKRHRAQIHQRIADVLRSRFPAIAEGQPEIIARHYSEAGRVEHAVPLFLAAAERALSRSANTEASRYVASGLALIPRVAEGPQRHDLALSLQLARANVMLQIKGYAELETIAALTEAKRILDAGVGTDLQRFSVLHGLWIANYAGGRMTLALNLARQYAAVADRQTDPTFRMIGHRILATSLIAVGEHAEAQSELAEAERYRDPDRQKALSYRFGQDPGLSVLCYKVWVCWFLGLPGQAARLGEKVLAELPDHDHANTVAYCTYWTGAQFALIADDHEAAARHAAALIAWCGEKKVEQFRLLAIVTHACAQAMRDPTAENIAAIRAAMDAERRSGARVSDSVFLCKLAQVLLAVGDVAGAEIAHQDGMDFVGESGERFWLPELHRVEGLIALRQPKPDRARAEACLLCAMETARRQKSRMLELRAAIDVAQLRCAAGQSGEAVAIMLPILATIESDDGACDIRRARALLATIESNDKRGVPVAAGGNILGVS